MWNTCRTKITSTFFQWVHNATQKPLWWSTNSDKIQETDQEFLTKTFNPSTLKVEGLIIPKRYRHLIFLRVYITSQFNKILNSAPWLQLFEIPKKQKNFYSYHFVRQMKKGQKTFLNIFYNFINEKFQLIKRWKTQT